ncbi:hypothetical protein chiPu_0022181 [Chiloscyllium punctatum]|uniref:Uncharacterized protein n=1 Tax=Chiloscyllium punctatum TaxID=137246 RepID=A0A401RDV9_CHIPU|nr:hypothetical protein [Chiloscyllium punctatum]
MLRDSAQAEMASVSESDVSAILSEGKESAGQPLRPRGALRRTSQLFELPWEVCRGEQRASRKRRGRPSGLSIRGWPSQGNPAQLHPLSP